MTATWHERLTNRLHAWVSFPLLAKELAETAARRRTYWLRVIYAVALYGIFALFMPRTYWTLSNSFYGVVGTGARMMESLIGIQYFGAILFLPALMCGRITQEKERESLALLFLTELKPWSIILQKYLGGLVLMLSFFLLGLPLAGVAYAFGGFGSGDSIWMLVGLLLMCLQIGALAIFFSAWCRATLGAFLATYFGLVVLYIVLPIVGGNLLDPDYSALLFPPIGIGRNNSSSVGLTAAIVVPLSTALLFLVLARLCLIRRALVPPSFFLQRLFARLDVFMKRINHLVGGVVLWRGPADTEMDQPIYWRETHRRVLGRPHYLIRIFVAVEILVVFVAFAVLYSDGSSGRSQEFGVLVGIVAALIALTLSAHAANSIVSERVSQTLEVLLTTPLSAREIVRQKERALRRLQLVCAVPLITLVAIQAFFEVSSETDAYLACSLLCILIYLPLFTWLSLWISLRVRTRFQAIIWAVGALALWTALSPLLFYMASEFGRKDWRYLPLLSPVSVCFANEIGELRQAFRLDYIAGVNIPRNASVWPVILLNAALYAVIALVIRWRLFANAEKLLRR